MSEELEKVGAEKDASTESEPSLVASLFSKLELPEMLGNQFASFFLLKELLAALTRADILKIAQAEQMLASVSEQIARICSNLSKDVGPGKMYTAADIERLKKSAEQYLAQIRKELNKAP